MRIAHGSDSILIELHNSNTMAVLTVNRKRKRRQFIVDAFPDSNLARDESMTSQEDSLELVLSAAIAHYLPIFIFSLASSVPASSEDFRALSKDKNFMKLLGHTRNNFDRRHELLLKE
jgi:hypothetical protein